MTIYKLILTLISIIATVNLSAQVSMRISDAVGEKGEDVEICVHVSGFDSITSMQFSVNWDSTVLSFQSVDNLTEALPDFSDKEIGLVDASSGALRVLWFDNATQGLSVPDSTQLFVVKFKIIGEEGTTSGVTITNAPLTIEFTDSKGAMVDLSEIEAGEVKVPGMSTSLTYLEASNGMQLHQNQPNPFHSYTRIKVFFPSSGSAKLLITDITGKVIFQDRFNTTQGENTIEIGSNQLRTPGIYNYTVQSGPYQLSRKMILLPR